LSCFLAALITLTMARVLELSSAHRRLTSVHQPGMATGAIGVDSGGWQGMDRAELEICVPQAGIGEMP